MHTINLGNYNYRTDLIIEQLDEKKSVIYEKNGVKVSRISVSNDENLRNGKYVTISFKDITDKDNYSSVLNTFIDEFKHFLDDFSFEKILVIGLGNNDATPDALGPKTIDNVLVTRHLFELGEVDSNYRNVCSFKPGVTGTTGIETSESILAITSKLNVDLVIVIDALAARSIERVNKTIQISDSGIFPGSGIGNNRGEISKNTLNIPVISIGVPTIVDAVTIVYDTLHYVLKKINYNIENINNNKLKLVVNDSNFINSSELSEKYSKEVLGILGTLNDDEQKQLFYEVLSPVNYNLMVTPKEIDFIIEKLSTLIGMGINKSLHKNFNTTN